jgi:hypothetical protein
MSHFQKNKEFYDKPIRLSEGEKKDPFIVLDEFFTDYNLSEIREINQQADQACLTTDTPPFDDPDKRNCTSIGPLRLRFFALSKEIQIHFPRAASRKGLSVLYLFNLYQKTATKKQNRKRS